MEVGLLDALTRLDQLTDDESFALGLEYFRREPAQKKARWVPLVLAMAWAESHVDEGPPHEAMTLLREVLENLAEGNEEVP